MGYVVTTETATVYKVRFAKEGDEKQRFGWADAAVRTFPRGGAVSIQSDYGTYAYTWTATGDGPFLEFLCRLDFDYFMTKACGDYHVFDYEKTVRNLKRRIIEQRRTGAMHDMSKDDARGLWDILEASEHTSNADYFVSELLRHDVMCEWFDGDYCDIALYSPNPQAVGFWNEIWPHLVAAWREELGKPAGDNAASQFSYDLISHLHRQRAFSLRTFGPGVRTKGVCDHIRKELCEVEAAPLDLVEWTDVILLAFDGAYRTGASPEEVVVALESKLTRNERRKWPDWRMVPADRAIEHDRSVQEEPAHV